MHPLLVWFLSLSSPSFCWPVFAKMPIGMRVADLFFINTVVLMKLSSSPSAKERQLKAALLHQFRCLVGIAKLV